MEPEASGAPEGGSESGAEGGSGDAVETGPRASDADRDRFAAQLTEHYSAGRLSDDEFEKRLERVYAARTLVELYAIVSDLPHPGPRPVVGWKSRRPWWRRARG